MALADVMKVLQTPIEYSFKWGEQDPVAGKLQAWVIVAAYVVATGQGGQFVTWATKYFSSLIHAVV